MSCPRCGSDRVAQFEASAEVKAPPAKESLPAVCCDCGLVTVGGAPLELPEGLEKDAKGLAEAGEEAGRKARDGLLKELSPDQRIAEYFSNVYRSGYLDGFSRALTFWRKVRYAERAMFLAQDLWAKGEHRIDDTKGWVGFDLAIYNELVEILSLGRRPDA